MDEILQRQIEEQRLKIADAYACLMTAMQRGDEGFSCLYLDEALQREKDKLQMLVTRITVRPERNPDDDCD